MLAEALQENGVFAEEAAGSRRGREDIIGLVFVIGMERNQAVAMHGDEPVFCGKSIRAERQACTK